jgi:hypothetical protein
VHVVSSPEPFGNCVQSGIVATLRLYFGNGGQHIVSVCPGSAMPLTYKVDLTLKVETAGILGVAAVDQEDERRYVARWRRCKRDPPQGFKVNGGRLFALAQIRDGGRAILCGDPIGNAAAGAATVEPKYEAGLLGGAAVDEGIHAQRPVQSDEPCRDTFKVREAGPPHERSVTKNPKIFLDGKLGKVHERALQ